MASIVPVGISVEESAALQKSSVVADLSDLINELSEMLKYPFSYGRFQSLHDRAQPFLRMIDTDLLEDQERLQNLLDDCESHLEIDALPILEELLFHCDEKKITPEKLTEFKEAARTLDKSDDDPNRISLRQIVQRHLQNLEKSLNGEAAASGQTIENKENACCSFAALAVSAGVAASAAIAYLSLQR